MKGLGWAVVAASLLLIVQAHAQAAVTAPKGVHDAPDGQRATLTDFRIMTRDDEDTVPGEEPYVKTEATGLITNLTDDRLETAICVIAYDDNGLQVSRDWSYGVNLGLGQSDTDSIVSWPVKKKLWQQVKSVKVFATRYCAVGGSPSKDNDSPIIQMIVNPNGQSQLSRAPAPAGVQGQSVIDQIGETATTGSAGSDDTEVHSKVIHVFKAAGEIVAALVNMDEIADSRGDNCSQMIGPIKIEGVQFSQSGATLESFRFTDSKGTQWSVPTNIGNLPNTPMREEANSFIRVGKTYYSHIQVCGSGGFASLIALYDMSISFGPN